MGRTRRGRWAVAAVALGVTAWAIGHGASRADVVGPPPDDCPDGTRGESCHGGPYCAPDACTSDGDCGAGETCAETMACMGSVVCAGLLPPDADIEDYRVDTVEGMCPDGTCASGECRAVRLCVPAAPPGGGGSDDGGCGCRAAGQGDTPLPVLFALNGIALLFWRRRRR